MLANLRPYLILSEKLGSLISQITPGAIERVSVEYIGEVTCMDNRPLTLSLLKGMLTPILGEIVNFVNVPVIVKDRNIKVTESVRSEAEDFTNLITVQVKTSEGENTVAGTIFGKGDPRVVKINNFRLEAVTEGHVLLIYNIDTPGTIGAIGSCLGKHQINITSMNVGQVLERGQNVIFLKTETQVSKEVVQELLSMENVNVVQSVDL